MNGRGRRCRKIAGSHVIAVIARDRKTKSHHGGTEKNWGLTAKDAKDAKECKTYHGGAERLRVGFATERERKNRENISLSMLLQGVLTMHPHPYAVSLQKTQVWGTLSGNDAHKDR